MANIEIQDSVLLWLKNAESLSSVDLLEKFQINIETLYGTLNSLVVANYIQLETQKVTKQSLNKEAEGYAKNGTPEFTIFSLIPPEGIERDVLEKTLGPAFKFGWNECMKKKIVTMRDGKVHRQVENYEDVDQKKLLSVLEGAPLTPELLKEFKQRKFLEEKTTNVYIIRKGPEYR
jgi:hypothetical protein